MIAAGIALVIGAAIFYETHLGGGATEENASWQSRMQSIVIAISAPSTSLSHFIAGFGPGQAAPYIVAETPSHLLPLWDYPAVTQDVNTVWSVFGTIYMEAGLIGLLFEIVIVGVALRAIIRSSAVILGSCILIAWLAGVGDDLIAPYFASGAVGFTSSLACFWPEVSVELYKVAASGDMNALAELHKRVVRPFYALRERGKGFEVTVMKEAMEMLGHPAGPVRPPLGKLSDKDRADLRAIIDSLDIPTAVDRAN